MTKLLLIILAGFAIAQHGVILEQDKAITKLDNTLTYVVYKCTGVMIPTIDEHNNE